MEFQFNVNEYFKRPIVEVGNTLLPPDFAGDRRALWNTVNKVAEVVNEMGEASAHAQGLNKPITTAERLRQSDQNLYLLIDPAANNGKGAVTGMLKIGRKGLYVFDREGQPYQMTPPCVLDFYVHEKRQRSGLGKKLFEYMLEKENVKPQDLAIDRPSEKFLNFLNKHYYLKSPIKQMNNYVVFDGFFPEVQKKESTECSPIKRSNGLQSTQSPNTQPLYGRYGAPRPPCSMGQIIHNTTAQKNSEPTSQNNYGISQEVSDLKYSSEPQEISYHHLIPAQISPQNRSTKKYIENPMHANASYQEKCSDNNQQQSDPQNALSFTEFNKPSSHPQNYQAHSNTPFIPNQVRMFPEKESIPQNNKTMESIGQNQMLHFIPNNPREQSDIQRNYTFSFNRDLQQQPVGTTKHHQNVFPPTQPSYSPQFHQNIMSNKLPIVNNPQQCYQVSEIVQETPRTDFQRIQQPTVSYQQQPQIGFNGHQQTYSQYNQLPHPLQIQQNTASPQQVINQPQQTYEMPKVIQNTPGGQLNFQTNAPSAISHGQQIRTNESQRDIAQENQSVHPSHNQQNSIPQQHQIINYPNHIYKPPEGVQDIHSRHLESQTHQPLAVIQKQAIEINESQQNNSQLNQPVPFPHISQNSNPQQYQIVDHPQQLHKAPEYVGVQKSPFISPQQEIVNKDGQQINFQQAPSFLSPQNTVPQQYPMQSHPQQVYQVQVMPGEHHQKNFPSSIQESKQQQQKLVAIAPHGIEQTPNANIAFNSQNTNPQKYPMDNNKTQFYHANNAHENQICQNQFQPTPNNNNYNSPSQETHNIGHEIAIRPSPNSQFPYQNTVSHNHVQGGISMSNQHIPPQYPQNIQAQQITSQYPQTTEINQSTMQHPYPITGNPPKQYYTNNIDTVPAQQNQSYVSNSAMHYTQGVPHEQVVPGKHVYQYSLPIETSQHQTIQEQINHHGTNQNTDTVGSLLHVDPKYFKPDPIQLKQSFVMQRGSSPRPKRESVASLMNAEQEYFENGLLRDQYRIPSRAAYEDQNSYPQKLQVTQPDARRYMPQNPLVTRPSKIIHSSAYNRQHYHNVEKTPDTFSKEPINSIQNATHNQQMNQPQLLPVESHHQPTLKNEFNQPLPVNPSHGYENVVNSQLPSASSNQYNMSHSYTTPTQQSITPQIVLPLQQKSFETKEIENEGIVQHNQTKLESTSPQKMIDEAIEENYVHSDKNPQVHRIHGQPDVKKPQNIAAIETNTLNEAEKIRQSSFIANDFKAHPEGQPKVNSEMKSSHEEMVARKRDVKRQCGLNEVDMRRKGFNSAVVKRPTNAQEIDTLEHGYPPQVFRKRPPPRNILTMRGR